MVALTKVTGEFGIDSGGKTPAIKLTEDAGGAARDSGSVLQKDANVMVVPNEAESTADEAAPNSSLNGVSNNDVSKTAAVSPKPLRSGLNVGMRAGLSR